MDAQFYQKLNPKEARPYLGTFLGQQEISLEEDVDGYGTIKVHDTTAGVVWEAHNQFIPFVVDGKKLYHEPFETCDMVASLRLLEHFFEGERPQLVSAWFGNFNDFRKAGSDHPQEFVIRQPNKAEAIMFAVIARNASNPLTLLEECRNDLLWNSSSLLEVLHLGSLVKGDIVDYYVFRIPSDIALQRELQERAYQQAQYTYSAFEKWAERMEKVEARYQEIMGLKFVFEQFGFYHAERTNQTKLRFIRQGTASLEFDLEADTKDSALEALHQLVAEKDAQ